MNILVQRGLYYAYGVYQFRWPVVLIAWALCTTGWVGATLLPDSYRSTARVFIDTSDILDPLLRGLAAEDLVGADIDLLKRTLGNDAFLASVGEEMRRYSNTSTSSEHDNRPNASALRLNPDASALKLNQEASDLFRISYESHSASYSRSVVRAVLSVINSQFVLRTKREIDSAQRFIGSQIDRYAQELTEAEERLARFKQENRAYLPGNATFIQEIQAKRKLRDQIRDDIERSRTRLEFLNAELAKTDPLNQSLDKNIGPLSPRQQRLADLALRIEELQVKYTEAHPDLVNARRELKNLTTTGAANGSSAHTLNTRTVNPAFERLRAPVAEEEGLYSNLSARQRSLDAEISQLSKHAFRVPAVEAELKRLNRDYDVIEGQYNAFVSRREQTIVTSQREEGAGGVNFQIIDAPDLPSRPVGPSRVRFLLVAFVTSVAIATTFGLAILHWRDPVLTATDLKGSFSYPLHGTITAFRPPVFQAIRLADTMLCFSAIVLLPAILALLVMIELRSGLGTSPAAAYIREILLEMQRSILSFK